MNYWNKDKKPGNWNKDKKRTNWSQSLKTTKTKVIKAKKVKKSLQYLLILKKFKNVIDYKNVKLLKAFLTKHGKIRPRRKTRIDVQKQHAVAKAIRKSRAFKLIPFTCDVKI
jgi:ribosomal protein S18